MASEGFNMEESDEDVFYECLSPPQTPSPSTTNTFYLHLSTLSIYCRQHNSVKYSNKASKLPQYGASKSIRGSVANDYLPHQKETTSLKSIVESSISSHMTFSATVSPTTPPSNPPSSYAQLSHVYENHENVENVELSPCFEAPPLSPSSSVSTSLSEPPTPTRNGSINRRRFWISRIPTPSPKASTSNDLDKALSPGANSEHLAGTPQQTPTPPTRKPRTIRAKHSLAAKKPTSSATSVKRRKVPDFVPQKDPCVPEGFKLVDWPKNHSIIEAEKVEHGHVIGYGTYPVPLSTQQLARQKRDIMRRKLRHYGVDDEVKIIRSSGSVSGESETSSEEDKISDKQVVTSKEDDNGVDNLAELNYFSLGILSAEKRKCA